ncbi:MAG: CDP-diacylglycerol--glycerol-3-phosphate 3-phosphatidyltransferase [Mycoplasmataceae bacterium]|nr:CDP-diacylglycerol--glycerol-3-phosphate 3-phosphatidyltransferase [Mycoplasmataceae bacterium]
MNFVLSGLLFILACITDWLDGYLARKNKWISNFGKLWDPIADKVLINGILICFGYIHLVPIWAVVIFITRDIIVDASRMYAANKQHLIAANFYGKLKTVCQMFAIMVIFLFFNSNDDSNPVWWCIQNLLIFMSLLLSVISGIIYMHHVLILNKPAHV